ncbi:hypothetical protein ANCCEY_03183 [Ancylostoma ceylanicum]|uniref:Uncharacterized protein n=1 Tax=Ancylostoma ceylanicum TaxID=53326 RepID=A0A0D6M0R4_9BILA|nr:hypothetical protein ANCCEY_03183 [Ancylostoma ceylanicum]
MDKAYDKFRVKLSNVVVSMAENVAKGRASLGDKESPLHILKPTGLDIQIHKCSIDDLRLPRMRIIGALPDIVIGISDIRLLDLTRLLLSIPKPEPDPEVAAIEEKLIESTEIKVKDRAKMKTIMEVQEIESDEKPAQEAAADDSQKSKTSEQQVQLELDLHLNQIGVIVLRKDDVLCEVSILRMGCKLQMRTFDMVVTAELGAIRVSMPMFKSIDPKRKCLYFIDNNEEEGSLMTLKFIQANPESPFFATEYQSTEQYIEFKFRKLLVSLHQEGLMELKQFGEKMQAEMNALQKVEEKPVEEAIEQGARKLSRQISGSVESLAAVSRDAQKQAAAVKKRRGKRSAAEEEEQAARVIKMRLEATIGSLGVAIGTEKSLETWIAIENIRADVKMTVKAMNVIATLQTVKMEDMTEGSLYRKLLSVAGEKEMLRFEMVQYQRTDEQKKLMQPSDIDMSVKVRLAQMRFIFLNLWLCRLMAWMAPFQEEAARAAAAAQAAASEKAAEAAQNVKQMLAESPPRIQLDVQLEAPIIVVPQLSKSRNALVLILGKLMVNNHITGDRQNPKIIMDRMEVKLMDMTFGIGRMGDDASTFDMKCEVLEPLSFNIALQLEKKKLSTKASSAPKAVATPAPAPVEAPKPKIVFQFTLDNIVAVLYMGGSDESGVRNVNDAFAAMRLHGLKLSGTIKEDNSMNVAISLNTFTMADERREKTKIHMLLDKKNANQADRFLALAFSQDAQQNKNVKLKMSAFFICLCPEFLGCLSRFFTVDKTEEDLQNEVEAIKAVGGSKPTAAQTTAAASDGPDTPPPSIVLDCDMQGVEVILVENSMEPDTTQALILSFNMKMAAHPSPTEQVMSGGIEKLAMFSSYYAQSRRNEVTYEVLKPMNIGIEMRIDTPTKATNLVLKMSPMEVRMSPSIIRLLSAVNAEFAKSSAVDQKTTTVSSPKPREFPNYWKPKRIDQKKFWFFTVPTAQEACDENEGTASNRAPVEHAHVEMERMNFTLEAGDSSVPVPLIFMQILMNAEASGWSSALQASADLSLQMSYYNEASSVWEPVIEPVEVSTDNWSPWNLKMTVKGRNKMDPLDSRPGMDVKIEADDILNITITKSFLSLLNKVSEAFAHAAKQISPPTTRQLPGTSAFLVLNETGMIIKMSDSDTLQVSENGEDVEAPHGRFVDLRMNKEAAAVAAESQDKERLSTNQVELKADLRINLLDTVRNIKIGRAGKIAVPLPKKSDGGKQWKVIVETSIENGRRLITFTSHVEVTNHLDVPMELYSKNNTSLDMFGTVAPGETLKLVVPLLFSATGEIYFRPANDKCEVSFESVTWHQFTHQKRQVIRCDLSEDTTKGYFFETVVLEEKVREGIDQYTEVYSLHLYPPLQFHNILPFPVTLEIPVAMDLGPGENLQLNMVPGHRLRLWAPYLGEMYALDMTIPEEKKDLEVVALNTETGSSELELEYAVKHLPDENPLILPFPSTDFTKKKKSRVLVEEAGAWSQEFPLDTVGNPARITCKGKDRDYELTVNIQLCQSGLTKIVTFCPFYLVSNLGKWDMQVREEGQSTWTDVPAEKCVGIWPQQRSKRKFLCARYAGQQQESLLFPFTENFETLCHIDNDNVGVEVCVSTSESSVAIHLTPFQPGMAPVCIMNNLNIPINFGQKGHTMQTVATNEMVYFTWDNVTEERTMQFTVGDFKGEDKLDQNKLDELKLDANVRKFAYTANFLIGQQRVMLFTRDLDIARTAYGSWETDTVDMQAELALQGVGLSIVDNNVGKELLYIGISSSDILWEEEVKKGRFKPFAVKIMQALEEKYQEHLVEPKKEYEPIDAYEVCMETMIMRKKKGKEVKIRRIFEKGIF